MDTNLTLMQISALTVAGMCHALLGSVKVPLARKMEIDEARVGGLVSVFGVTLIPMVFAAGFLVDLIGVSGKQAVIGGGFVVVIISLIMLSRLKTYRVALLAVLLLGVGWSALVNVLNVTSPPAFLPPEEIASRISYAMNMGDFIFGMGAFMTPLLVVALVKWVKFEAVFLLLAGLALIPLLQGFGVDWEVLYAEPTDSVAVLPRVLLSRSDRGLDGDLGDHACDQPGHFRRQGVGAAVRVLADLYGFTTGDSVVASRRAGRSARCRHVGAVHRIHDWTGRQSKFADDMRDDHRRRPDPWTDIPHVDRNPADERRGSAAWPRCRSLLRHRRHRLDGGPYADRILRETQHRSKSVLRRNGIRRRPDRSFCRTLRPTLIVALHRDRFVMA